MSDFDVCREEMPALPPLDDAAVEAFVTGRRGPVDEIESLVLFAQDLEAAVRGPAPMGKPDLMALLAEGFSPPAPAASPPASVRRTWPRRRWARLAGLGLVTKLGLGMGVAAASVAGAGAGGLLPSPLQHTVARAVEGVTPFQLPDRSRSSQPGPVSPDVTAGGAATPAPPPASPSSGPAGPALPPGGAGQPPATGHSSAPTSPSPPGLARAGQTPAAGHAPTSVPAVGGHPTPPALPAPPGSRGAGDEHGITPAPPGDQGSAPPGHP